MKNITQDSVKNILFQVAAEVTGHDEADIEPSMYLESDLGLDSIKTVEFLDLLMSRMPKEIMQEFSAFSASGRMQEFETLEDYMSIFIDLVGDPDTDNEQQGEIETVVKASIETEVSTPLNSLSKNDLFEIISNITGHKSTELNEDLFLESDLGIDSIKMVQVINALTNRLSEEAKLEISESEALSNIAYAETLADLIKIFCGNHSDKTDTSAKDGNTDISVTDDKTVDQVVEKVHAQIPFLIANYAVSTCSLNSRVGVKGNLDLDKVRKVWQLLVDTNPMLRAIFELPEKTGKIKDCQLNVLKNPKVPEVAYRDIRDKSQDEQKTFLDSEVHANLAYQWDLQIWPLHRFSVYQTGNDVFQIFFHNHHLVSDGLSNQHIVRNFLQLYGELENKPKLQVTENISAQELNEKVRKLNDWEDTGNVDKVLAQAGAASAERFFWKPAGVAAPSSYALTKTFSFELSEENTAGLIDAVSLWKKPVNSLLVAAYVSSLADVDPSLKEAVINVPTSGRVCPGVDMGDTVGCFAQNLALRFDVPNSSDTWENTVGKVHQTIQNWIGHGVDRMQTKSAALTVGALSMVNGAIEEPLAGLVRGGLKSNIYLPYIGKTRIATHYGPLVVTDYQASTVTNAGTLDTVMEVFHGRLVMTTNYDSNVYTTEFIQKLAETFTKKIVSLINASPSAESKSVTSMVSSHIELMIREAAESISLTHLSLADFAKDLETELGLDSLEKIRLIAKLQSMQDNLDVSALLECRSLYEMANTIAGLADENEVQINDSALNDSAGSEQQQRTIGQDNEIPLHKIIESCRNYPNELAICVEGSGLTYEGLQKVSNQVAHILRDQGVVRGDKVGVMMDRGSTFISAIVGILKAGAAYVPLDPLYPDDRIQYMVKHANLDVVLTDGQNKQKLDRITQDLPANCYRIEIVEQNTGTLPTGENFIAPTIGDYEDSDFIQALDPDDLMVVLYTSGSTGVPKGVALSHRGYQNRFEWHQELFPVSIGSRVAQRTSICFDVSVWELLWPLMHGATTCPVSQRVVKNPWELAAWIENKNISIMHFVPSLFGEFLAAIKSTSHTFKKLNWLIFSGESLPVSFVKEWYERYGNTTRLANLYGPTEASIDVTAHIVPGCPSERIERIPIGRAMKSVELYVLDQNMQKVAQGEMGELWIGGVQLAKGYLNDDIKTKTAFKHNPYFQGDNSKVIYRTGDLVSELSDGQLDYHGRVDSQIKIRGFRIELGEIESVFTSLPYIREAAVTVVENESGSKKLQAWLVGKETAQSELAADVSKKLPHYMVPQRFQWLDTLPKNHNGKLDRKRLGENNNNATAGDPPKNGAETQIASDAQTYLPSSSDLTPAQNWLVRYFDAPYQWAGFTRFQYLHALELSTFNESLNRLIKRHKALRSKFLKTEEGWKQIEIATIKPVKAEFYDGQHLTSAELEEQLKPLIAERVEELRLDAWPLIRVIVIKRDEKKYDISLIGHHMVSDMISNQVLFEDLWKIYSSLLRGDVTAVPKEANDYDNYLTKVAQESKIKGDAYLKYWTDLFSSAENTMGLPPGCENGGNTEVSTQKYRFELNAGLSKDLQKCKKLFGCSMYILLLAPLYRVIGKWYGKSQVVISHRTHGRDFGEGVQYFTAVGNLAVNYPLAVQVDSKNSWKETIDAIKTAIDQVPLNGISYDMLSDKLPENMYPDEKLTPVRVNYLGHREPLKSNIFSNPQENWDQRYSPETQKRTSMMEIFLSFVDGKLCVEIDYSKDIFSQETIEQVASYYLSELNELATQKLAVVHGDAGYPVKSEKIKKLHGNRGNARSLEGKTAIITGASRGIGYTVAKRMAELGANLVIVSRKNEDLQRVVSEVGRFDTKAFPFAADVTDYEQVKSVVQFTAQQFGGVDILVNNAGITGMSSLINSDPKDWKRIFDVNVMGAFNFCKLVTRSMMSRGGGKIVNMGSDSSLIGYPLFSAYAASKHAVLGLTKSLAEELKQSNIQVNAVCPAFVDTQMTPQTFRKNSIPTDKIADVILFLVSELSDSITGEHLNVFGKQDMYWYGSEKMKYLESIVK